MILSSSFVSRVTACVMFLNLSSGLPIGSAALARALAASFTWFGFFSSISHLAWATAVTGRIASASERASETRNRVIRSLLA